MSDIRDRFLEHWWMRAWTSAIGVGHTTGKASELADKCLEEFKKRIEKEETE